MNLTAKEQKVLTMCIIKESIEYAKDNNKSFEDVLVEDLFPGTPYQPFSNMVLYNLKTLKELGYIDGEVKLNNEYMEEITNDTDDVDILTSTFDITGITQKGEAYIKSGELGVLAAEVGIVAKDFKEKAFSALKYVGSTALQTAIEVAVTTALGTI